MSILDKLTGGELRERRIDEWPSLNLVCQQKDPDEIGSMTHQFGFYLEGRVRVEFYCNKAQYHDARRNAERQLIGLLYASVRDPILRAKSCVYAGDPKGVLAALLEIEKEIGL